MVIATPDHWHVPIAAAAARSGKDMYVEKPLGLSIEQDKALRSAILRMAISSSTARSSGASTPTAHSRVSWSATATWARSRRSTSWHLPASPGALRNRSRSRMGSTTTCGLALHRSAHTRRTGVPVQGLIMCTTTRWDSLRVGRPPLGHHALGLPADPGGIRRYRNHPHAGSVQCHHQLGYPGAVRRGRPLHIQGRPGQDDLCWRERLGRGLASRHRRLSQGPYCQPRIKPGQIRLLQAENHYQNFIEAVKARRQPASPFDSAAQSDFVSHLCDIAIRTGRKIQWDPVKEEIVGDPAASRMMTRPMRSPWFL